MKLVFSHLNLKFNPFGELNAEQRKQVCVVNIDSIKDSLNQHAVAIQFLADHGRGKTTHLLSLHKHYPETEYIKLYAGDQPVFAQQSCRFVDSIENLSKKNRRLLYNKSGSLACTSHTDLSHELKSAGYQVVTKIICQSDEEILKQVFNKRIEFSRRNSGEIPLIKNSHIKNLKFRYGDDIRAMEHHLYEKFQCLERIEYVEM